MTPVRSAADACVRSMREFGVRACAAALAVQVRLHRCRERDMGSFAKNVKWMGVFVLAGILSLSAPGRVLADDGGDAGPNGGERMRPVAPRRVIRAAARGGEEARCAGAFDGARADAARSRGAVGAARGGVGGEERRAKKADGAAEAVRGHAECGVEATTSERSCARGRCDSRSSMRGERSKLRSANVE